MRVRLMLALALTAGCTSLEVRPQLIIQVSPEQITSDSTGNVVVGYQLQNVSAERLFLVGCPAVPSGVVELRAAGPWREAWQFHTICLAILSPVGLTLEPGATLADTLRLALPPDLPASTLFRIRVYYGTSAADPYAASAVSAALPVR